MINTQRSTNIIDPVMNNIPILCPPSAINPIKLITNAIPPNTTIEITEIRDWNTSHIHNPSIATIESSTMKYDEATKVDANKTIYQAINTGTRDILALYDERASDAILTKSPAQITITDDQFASSVASERSTVIPTIAIPWSESICSDAANRL
jgi:hypothetical protein